MKAPGPRAHARQGEAEGRGHVVRKQAAQVGHQSRVHRRREGQAPGGSEPKPVRLLSGGNPQIAKGDGDAPVQAYIAAMPGWKSEVGRRLDALIARSLPNVRRAVKWTPYVKVTFFRGTSLRSVPPGASKGEGTRYMDIHEGELDVAQMAAWVQQAAALPGWIPGRPS